MRKLILTGLVLALLLTLFSAYEFIRFNDGRLHLVFCNVGQGDGIFIRTPKGFSIIEDAGPDDSILSCISRHAPFWERKISLMILSHPHEDHMAGMIPVLSRYKVSNFATEKLANTTSIYNTLFQLVKDKNVPEKIFYAGDSFKTSDSVRFIILGPTRELIASTPNGIIRESREDGSLITLISFGNFEAVLTGDAPLEEVQSAVNSLKPIEVFQIPHHGSRFNIDKEILSSVFPKLAVISVGKNKYGHPSPEVLNILTSLEIKYLRTDLPAGRQDQRGDVEIIADKDGKFAVR